MTSLIDPGISPGDFIEGKLESGAIRALHEKDLLQSLIASANIKFRRGLEAEFEDVPEFVFVGSDDEDQTSSPETPESSNELVYFSNDSALDDNSAVIGGAVVNNICLVVPNDEKKKFGDLPVVAFQGSATTKSQLLVLPEHSKEGSKFQPPALIFPADENSGYDTEKEKQPSLSPTLLTQSIKSGTDAETKPKSGEGSEVIEIEIETKKDDKKKSDQKVAATDLDHYVLSGDIKNFFGIKGLKAKLYKFKGELIMPETFTPALKTLPDEVHEIFKLFLLQKLMVLKALRIRQTMKSKGRRGRTRRRRRVMLKAKRNPRGKQKASLIPR